MLHFALYRAAQQKNTNSKKKKLFIFFKNMQIQHFLIKDDMQITKYFQRLKRQCLMFWVFRSNILLEMKSIGACCGISMDKGEMKRWWIKMTNLWNLTGFKNFLRETKFEGIIVEITCLKDVFQFYWYCFCLGKWRKNEQEFYLEKFQVLCF